MKQKILALRKKGFSYRQIEKKLGCSKSTISYHCGGGQKEKAHHRVTEYKRGVKYLLVQHFGGSCKICGFNKFLSALEFHHLDPSKKDFAVNKGGKSFKYALTEAKKCLLVCANCHRGIHSKEITI